ncbi:hypothetical protein [Levilactobacillus brevis]|uniref:hypothetical protein n=1 Tax=Levilactobacillus brevis TaxID=1580 RepID=UPI0030D5D9A1
MAKWNQIVITDAGYQLSAQTLAGKRIQYTHAQTTDKDMSAMTSDQLKAVTKLDDVVQDLSIGIVTVQDDHTVNVPVTVANQDLAADYLLSAMAIYAKPVDPTDGDEILYGIATAVTPDLIPKQDGATVVGTNFKLKLHVGRADNVEIIITPDGSVSNDELMGILKNYLTQADLNKALPETIIDSSKPADFKESVTLEKGAVDGAGNAIATTKNLADGDATTLKAAKAYADTQASDKVKTANTDNWQKTKVTGDDGGNKYSFTTANTTDLVAAIQALPLGYHTFYCQAGVQGNPSSQSVRGIAEITTAGANPLGVGYLTDSTGAFWSFYVDSSGLKLKRSADVDSIDPSVIVKTTLTASDDVLNLDYGSYTISGPLPKNAPDLENTGINWGTLVVLKTLSGANKTLEYRDVKGNVLINILSGKPLTWSGWHIPNENSLAIGAGANKITANGNTFVPLAINVATGEICLPDGTAITLSLPGGVKLGDHMLNISATDGLTIDNQAYFTAVADEATAASKAAADPLHNYTTEE